MGRYVIMNAMILYGVAFLPEEAKAIRKAKRTAARETSWSEAVPSGAERCRKEAFYIFFNTGGPDETSYER